MEKPTYIFAIALFLIVGSCSTNDPSPTTVPVSTPNNNPLIAQVVPDDGFVHNVTEAREVLGFLKSFYREKLKYSVEEPVPAFTSKISGIEGEAITSGSIVVQRNLGTIEEYKVTLETDFNKYRDPKFLMNGTVARYEIFSFNLDGNSFSSTSLYFDFEYNGRKIKDTIDCSYSFVKATGLASCRVKNSLNTYTWYE